MRLLLGHPELGPGALRQPQRRVNRSLRCTRTSSRCEGSPSCRPIAGVLADADVVFLALPHGESAALAAALPPGVVVVDLGADHRLEAAVSAAWQAYRMPPSACRAEAELRGGGVLPWAISVWRWWA